MILSKVEYHGFDYHDLSPSTTTLDLQLRLSFSDGAPPLFVSWTWERRTEDRCYSITFETTPFYTDDVQQVFDASGTAFWRRLIGREITIAHVDPDFEILEVRSGDVRTFLSSQDMDTVTISFDDPRQTWPLIVITGGPGSGKSTLIEALAREGYATVSSEAGRAIIQDQVAIGGTALPWTDPRLFAELMLSWEMRSHREAAALAKTAVFFDRGVPDVIGYLGVTGLPVPPHMDAAALMMRYHGRVFIAPPWPAIYGQDTERKQTLDEAVRTYEAMVATYTAYGYELIELPKAPVAERVRFIIDRIPHLHA